MGGALWVETPVHCAQISLLVGGEVMAVIMQSREVAA